MNSLDATPIPVVSLTAETSGNATRKPNRPSCDAVPRTTATAPVHSPRESMRSSVRGGPIDDGRTNSFCNRSQSLSRYSPESSSRGRGSNKVTFLSFFLLKVYTYFKNSLARFISL